MNHVSVVIPTRGRPELVARAVASALGRARPFGAVNVTARSPIRDASSSSGAKWLPVIWTVAPDIWSSSMGCARSFTRVASRSLMVQVRTGGRKK